MAIKKAIGIDLGTTNSCVSYFKSTDGSQGAPITIPVNGAQTLPSCVSLVNGEYIVGSQAYDMRYLPNTIYSIKRKIGIEDSVSLTDSVTGETRTLSPKEVSTIILKEIKKTVDRDFGSTDIVTITVPAHFSALQTKLTQEAGIDAGWDEVYIIKEPTAASLAYQIETEKETERLLIFDLGGGTFDVAMVELMTPQDEEVTPVQQAESNPLLQDFYGIKETTETTKNKIVRVLASDGDVQLGGDDIDKAILRRVFYNASLHGEDLSARYPVGSADYEKLLLAVEQIKKEGFSGNITLDDYTITVSIDDVEFGYNKILRRCLDIAKPLISEAGVAIDRVILVGGSTKSQFVANYLEKHLGIKEVSSALNPDETVGLGASINTALKLGISNTKFIDIVPETIGILRSTGVPLTILKEGTPLPAQGTQVMQSVDDKDLKILLVGRRGVLIGTVMVPNNKKDTVVEIKASLSLDSVLTISAKTNTQNVEAKLELAKLKSAEASNQLDRKSQRRLSNIKEMLYKLNSESAIKQSLNKKANALIAELEDTKDFETIWTNNAGVITSLTKAYNNMLEDKRSDFITAEADFDMTEQVEKSITKQPSLSKKFI